MYALCTMNFFHPLPPEIQSLGHLVPVLVLPDVREARVAEDEPVVAPRGVRIVGHVVAQNALQKFGAVSVAGNL